jgi:hypothetical protein
MARTFYKYAERDADSQINWAEVGKGLSDMLSETNRVREEKKNALDSAQRETMKYLAETPNGEDASARMAALEYADQASNRMRIAKQLMEQGQMSVKDYTIFRQNLTDSTNLLFNANKAYQEEYAVKMQRSRDGISSALEPDRMKDAEIFGRWEDTGFYIGANGVVMAGKTTEKEVDGKKVRTLDQTPGNLRNIDTINQLILGKIDKYDYESPLNDWVKTLGEETQAITILGKIEQQGSITTTTDITNRSDIIPGDKEILYNFIQSENDKVKELAGTDFDKARLLMDSARIAPNGQAYELTNDPKEAATGVNFILKEYDPATRGVVYKITDAQTQDAENFIRNQARAKYDSITKVDVVNAVQRDESAATKAYFDNLYRQQKPGEQPKPVIPREITKITEIDKQGNKKIIGISRRVENLRFTEADGVENVVTDIGYNGKIGALEIKGYQVTGKQSEGTKEDQLVETFDEDGNKIETPKTVTTGRTATGRVSFLKNSKNSAPLLTSAVVRMVNPETGSNFNSINEAESYYRKIYQSELGKKGELDD